MTSNVHPHIPAKTNHCENNFDTLRLLLALTVVFSTCFLVADGSTDRDPFKQFVHGQLISSHLAIDCFFMMSGYLAVASVERCRSAWEYFVHRVRRFYPGFALAMLFFAAVVPVAGGSFSRRSFVRRAAGWLWHVVSLNQFRYHGVFAHNPFPGQIDEFLWPVGYGFACYLLTLLFHRTGLLQRGWLIAVILVVTAALGAGANASNWSAVPPRLHAVIGYPHLWVRAFPYYFGGTLVYLIRERVRWDWRLLVLALAALCGAAQFRPGWEAAFPFAGLYALFYFALNARVRLPNLARWGDFSYGVFLWHFSIAQLLVAHGIGLREPYKLLAVVAPLSVLAGALSWWGVERWFLPRGEASQRVRKSASQPGMVSSG